jgi:dihydroorotase
MEAIFPDTVIVRGSIQVQDGEFCGEPVGVDYVEHT